jgi:DNA-binding CsgD family transcriptional regulator/tetratricopeptide (TPR) repeat protein
MVEEMSPGDRPIPQPWGDTYRSLVGSDRSELDTTALEALAVSAHLIGDDDTCAGAWESAHKRHLEDGARDEAARCSFWLALSLMFRGQMAHAGGWLSRTEAVLGTDLECAASGYLLIPALLGALDSADGAGARELATRAGEFATRYEDHDLGALATLGHGQALISVGEETTGLAKLDEVMLSVEAGEVGPVTSGIVYCAVILECIQVFDMARASEWTSALDGWCRAQPDLVPYRGQCLVHQSQLHQAAGEWAEATNAAVVARDRLTDPPHPALGLACYQEAELHRVVGSTDAAADAYARASRAGYQPMPGLALLQLAEGDIETAAASIRRALQEASQPSHRPRLLAAAVEIFRASGDHPAASAAAEELSKIAAASTSDVLGAMADQASGTLLLDQGDISAALAKLRAATGTWQKLNMPYERARTGVLLGLGCEALGDSSTATLEFDNARSAFVSLGAGPDLAQLPSPAGRVGSPARPVDDPSGLSARELEVLTHVASGKTNPEIATELTISQHTVGRHLENIFAKLDVRSRAAATAYAYEHDLL